MKRNLFISLICFILIPAIPGFAQNPATVIDSLDIEIWPDYDKPSVLVLLTGTLPEDTRLPASVTLPLPKGAQLNAVARIDRADGNMKDDIFTSTDPPDRLTFITPDLGFRVEYYLPYSVAQNRRSFDYTWSSAISVNNFQIRVQRPSSASILNTIPATQDVIRSADGFDYHTFPRQAVAAGQSFSLQVNYIMTAPQLSAASLPFPNTSKQLPASPDTSTKGSGINWALVVIIGGGLLIFGALIWQMASRSAATKNRKPNDSKSARRSRVKFCPHCGEPIDKGDRFCGGCGSEL
jgi:hypothetical protein